MLRWEPEGHYCCTKFIAIMPFWYSTEHSWTTLTPFSFSGDKMKDWDINARHKSQFYLIFLKTNNPTIFTSTAEVLFPFLTFFHKVTTTKWSTPFTYSAKWLAHLIFWNTTSISCTSSKSIWYTVFVFAAYEIFSPDKNGHTDLFQLLLLYITGTACTFILIFMQYSCLLLMLYLYTR